MTQRSVAPLGGIVLVPATLAFTVSDYSMPSSLSGARAMEAREAAERAGEQP